MKKIYFILTALLLFSCASESPLPPEVNISETPEINLDATVEAMVDAKLKDLLPTPTPEILIKGGSGSLKVDDNNEVESEIKIIVQTPTPAPTPSPTPEPTPTPKVEVVEIIYGKNIALDSTLLKLSDITYFYRNEAPHGEFTYEEEDVGFNTPNPENCKNYFSKDYFPEHIKSRNFTAIKILENLRLSEVKTNIEIFSSIDDAKNSMNDNQRWMKCKNNKNLWEYSSEDLEESIKPNLDNYEHMYIVNKIDSSSYDAILFFRIKNIVGSVTYSDSSLGSEYALFDSGGLGYSMTILAERMVANFLDSEDIPFTESRETEVSPELRRYDVWCPAGQIRSGLTRECVSPLESCTLLGYDSLIYEDDGFGFTCGCNGVAMALQSGTTCDTPPPTPAPSPFGPPPAPPPLDPGPPPGGSGPGPAMP